MGGKTGTTTQQSSVSIPPEVLARYNSVNARAERTAEQPFTPYGGEFVAPLTGTQQAGISNINQAQGMATPYYNNAGQAMNTGYQAGSGLALASAGEVNPEALTGQNINQYMSPYIGSVVDTTMANLRQQQNEEQSKILGNQITSGAFGGDRGRIAQANLARQQGLATGQTVSSLMNQGYGQALTTAQQQQAQQLAASQANRAALAGAGQSLYSMGQGYGQGMAGLGTQAQESALKGAQAQLGAGTVQQQTQQAKNTADYNQFLQQQGYPFQVAQFLANIAMGTGALSGSSQQGTTTSPQSFFSDRRLKDDIEKIGKTFDGQDIVRYKYKGEPGTRIGLIAQDVEKHHPEAVGLAGGYRTVDYDKATDDAADRGHFAGGGLAGAEGGAVMPEMAGMGFASGGAPDINSMMAEILNAHQGMYPFGRAGLYGRTNSKAGAYGTEQMQTPTRGLMRVDSSQFARPAEHQGAGQQAMQGLNNARSIGSAYTDANSFLFGTAPNRDNPEGTRGTFGNAGNPSVSQGSVARAFSRDTPPTPPQANTPPPATTPPPRREEAPPRRPDEVEPPQAPVVDAGGMGLATGGLVRGHYAMGGLPFSEAGGYIPDAVLNDNDAEKNKKAMDSFAPKAPGAGQSGSGSGPGLLGGLGQIGGAIKGAETIGSAAAGAGEGIAELMAMLPAMFSDRRLKDDIEKIGKTFDGQDIVRYRYKGEPATQIGLIAQDVEKHHPNAVGLAGGYRTVDYRKATEDAADRGHFAGGGLAGMRHGYALDGEVVDEVVEPKQAGLAGAGDLNPEVERIRNALSAIESSGRYNTVGRDVVRPGRPTDRAYGRYQVMGENVGPWTEAAFGQRMTPDEFLGSSKAQDAVVRNRIQQGLDRYGNPQDVASVWFTGQPVAQSANSRDVNIGAPEYLRRFQAAYDANNTSAAAPEGRTGLRVPVSNDGSGQSNPADGGQGNEPPNRAEERQRRSGVNFAYPRERGEPNWLQRHQDWLVPVLSGLGAMASSPSRYLGSALLQGLAGGAQQYATMQNKAEEQQLARGTLEVSQEQARTAATREETASRQAALQVLDHFDRRYRRTDTSEGVRYIDLTGGAPLTIEQHAQQRATLYNSLISGVDSARALSGAQNRPAQTTQGPVVAPPAPPSAAPPGTPSGGPSAAPSGGPSAAPSGAPAEAAGTGTAGTGTTGTVPGPRAAPQIAPPAQYAPMNEQDRVAHSEAMSLLQPRIDRLAELDRRIADIGRESGLAAIPSTLQKTRDDLYAEINQRLLGEKPIENPRGPQNDYFGRQRNIAALREEEQKAHDAEVNAFEQNSPAVTSSLRNVAGLLRTTPTGAATAALATFSSILRSLPATSGISGETLRNIQSANEVIRTTAMRQALDTLKNNPGTLPRSNMSLLDALATVVSSDKGPEGNFETLTDALADDARTRDFNTAARNKPPHMPMGQFRQQWNGDPANSRERYIATARSEMPGFAGMSHESRQRLGTLDAQIPANLRDRNGNPFAGINVGQSENGPVFQVNIQGRQPQYYNSRGEPIEAPQTRQPAPAAAP